MNCEKKKNHHNEYLGSARGINQGVFFPRIFNYFSAPQLDLIPEISHATLRDRLETFVIGREYLTVILHVIFYDKNLNVSINACC